MPSKNAMDKDDPRIIKAFNEAVEEMKKGWGAAEELPSYEHKEDEFCTCDKCREFRYDQAHEEL